SPALSRMTASGTARATYSSAAWKVGRTMLSQPATASRSASVAALEPSTATRSTASLLGSPSTTVRGDRAPLAPKSPLRGSPQPLGKVAGRGRGPCTGTGGCPSSDDALAGVVAVFLSSSVTCGSSFVVSAFALSDFSTRPNLLGGSVSRRDAHSCI